MAIVLGQMTTLLSRPLGTSSSQWFDEKTCIGKVDLGIVFLQQIYIKRKIKFAHGIVLCLVMMSQLLSSPINGERNSPNHTRKHRGIYC